MKVKATDKTAPEIRITGPSMEPSVSVGLGAINIEGTASDDFDLTQIAWANNRGGSGMTRAGSRWVVGAVALQPGVNVIAVTAVDASGNSSFDEIRITYDRGVPTVSITAPTSTGSYATSASTVTVAGVAADDQGIAQVTWTTDKGQSGVASGTTGVDDSVSERGRGHDGAHRDGDGQVGKQRPCVAQPRASRCGRRR